MGRVNYGDGRQALIEATVRVIGEHGWGGLTNRRVADAAQVDNTLITHHFGGRDALVSAAAEWAVAHSIAQADLALASELSGPFGEALLALVDLDPRIQAFQIELILAARRDVRLRPVVTRLYESYLGSAKELLENAYGLAPETDLARAVFAALEGLVLQVLSVVDPDEVRQAIAALDRLVLGYRAQFDAR
ncbi:TetR/AcrR family transcriptional regulator [Microbacterium sp.]|uniref:TetR/AcrR family transcriptional regulator n=1 Tax=Microbacterium sp. TaxID=51671 RepID=UPI003A84FA8C